MNELTKEQQIRQSVICAMLPGVNIKNIDSHPALMSALKRCLLVADIAAHYIYEGDIATISDIFDTLNERLIETFEDREQDAVNARKMRLLNNLNL